MRVARAPCTAVLIGLMLCGCHGQPPSAQSGFSAAALYNAANAYARAGQPGLAILNYERARLLAPNDPDIEANIRLLREGLRLPSESPNALIRALTVTSPTAAAWFGLVGLVLLGASLLARQISRRYRWGGRVAAVVGSALLGLTVANGLALWPRLHEAVVMAGHTAVRVSPAPMAEQLFVLPEAETVKMRAEHAGFVLIETRGGAIGWAPRASLAPVVPLD